MIWEPFPSFQTSCITTHANTIWFNLKSKWIEHLGAAELQEDRAPEASSWRRAWGLRPWSISKAFPKYFESRKEFLPTEVERSLQYVFLNVCWRFRGAWQSEKLESAFARICPLQILLLSGPQPPRGEPRPRTFSTDPIRNFCRAEVKFFERLTLAWSFGSDCFPRQGMKKDVVT